MLLLVFLSVGCGQDQPSAKNLASTTDGTVASVVPSETGVIASIDLPSLVRLGPAEEIELIAQAIGVNGQPMSDVPMHWTIHELSGGVNDSDNFVATSVAGTYENAIRVTATHQGVTVSATADVIVVPGPVARVDILPSSSTLFTGDSTELEATAWDEYQNQVVIDDVNWQAEAGNLVGSGTTASFKAGREPGSVAISANVVAKDRIVAGNTELHVEQGYCDTRQANVEWDVKWWALNDDRSKGEILGNTRFSRLSNDWGTGPVYRDRDSKVQLEATTQIVVQRQGPVFFSIGGDDGYRMSLSGDEILSDWSNHSFRTSKVLKNLEPGIYDLRVDYYEWRGEARLEIRADSDVLEWEEVTECFGGYVKVPDHRYIVFPNGENIEEVADRVGVSPSRIVPAIGSETDSVLVPTGEDRPRKVILLQGIDSKASCDDLRSVQHLESDDGRGSNRGLISDRDQQPEINFATRRATIIRAIQTGFWESVGQPSPLASDDVLTFSYANTYTDCQTGRVYRPSNLPLLPSTYATYSKADTCIGVAAAAERLKALIERILLIEPATRFDLIGHSMGGMIAAYLVATSPDDFVTDRISGVVTLDSPLLGTQKKNPASSCRYQSTAWRDIEGSTPVVDEIQSVAKSANLSFLSINSSKIGQTVSGGSLETVDCSSESTAALSMFGALIGGALNPWGALAGLFLGAEYGEYGIGHSCVWLDDVALDALAEIINQRN